MENKRTETKWQYQLSQAACTFEFKNWQRDESAKMKKIEIVCKSEHSSSSSMSSSSSSLEDMVRVETLKAINKIKIEMNRCEHCEYTIQRHRRLTHFSAQFYDSEEMHEFVNIIRTTTTTTSKRQRSHITILFVRGNSLLFDYYCYYRLADLLRLGHEHFVEHVRTRSAEKSNANP